MASFHFARLDQNADELVDSRDGQSTVDALARMGTTSMVFEEMIRFVMRYDADNSFGLNQAERAAVQVAIWGTGPVPAPLGIVSLRLQSAALSS
ncbi:hypothetical protein DVA67_030460 [Solirubrobacter sp. CPCC 204708]|uniref:Uncharacterized protein n=1 Tax=Solirubrobacter deserti TaxID=2282478 RepID=A0ABT4RIE6_9ACTN|nr:hypothetical protein [Solirubrobacter deserti]MBE2320326.1 hypothetical protein [Solirubrobacter deserti]MDA0138288.1 hypothetical protein [Solirubrobacter deserti]